MPHRRHDVATRRAHRRQAPHVVNRAIRHLNLAVALAGLAACATVRVIPEAHAETPETSDALQPLESVVVQSGDTLLGIAALPTGSWFGVDGLLRWLFRRGKSA